MGEAAYLSELKCKKFLCKEAIHSKSEWRKAALKKKNELQNAGISAFEAHPEYQDITKCKPDDDDDYPSISECARINQPTPPGRQAPSNRPANTGKRGRCPKGTAFNKRTQNCEAKNRRGSPVKPTSPVRPGSAKKRCPNGTKRNKRTGNCEAKNRRGSPIKSPSPLPKSYGDFRPSSAKRGRCPNGTRRNKKTGDCEEK